LGKGKSRDGAVWEWYSTALSRSDKYLDMDMIPEKRIKV
jgi:hypothetical protein